MPTDSPEEATYRQRARQFLAEHAPAHARTATPTALLASDPDPAAEAAHMESCRAWQRTLYDHGWAGITWPEEFGGQGGQRWQQIIFNEELAQYDVTSGFLGSTIAMVGPALIAHGTSQQQRQHLAPLLRGDVVWCQLFSEPEAGSDLANLRTQAILDGDEWLVNGQKVWNSSAHLADWAILLVRTDPDAPKHKGITFLLADMTTPGIDPRPLRQITGSAHFNEVFLSDVRIPRENVLGEVNGGWAPTRTVLANESMVIGSSASSTARFDSAASLIDLAQRRGRNRNPMIRQQLARCYIAEKLLGWMGSRIQQDIRQGRPPSIDGSALKVFWSEGRRDKGELAMAILGADGVASDGVVAEAGAAGRTDAVGADRATDTEIELWRAETLNRFWASIGGGTDEVHRNNMSERALGLPREPRVDKDRPWRETTNP